MSIDLDKLEQVAKAANAHSVELGCEWFTEEEAACNLEQADAAFVAAASPQVVLELISRLRAAEENCQAARLRANANAEMLKGLQSQSPVVAVPDRVVDAVMLNITEAWRLGQAMYQYSSKNSGKAMQKAVETEEEFDRLKNRVRAMLAAAPQTAVAEPEGAKLVPIRLIKKAIADDHSWRSAGHEEPPTYTGSAGDLWALIARDTDPESVIQK